MFGFGKKKESKNYKEFKGGLKLYKDVNIGDDGTNLILNNVSGAAIVPKRAIEYATMTKQSMMMSKVQVFGKANIIAEASYPHKQAKQVMDFINQNFPNN